MSDNWLALIPRDHTYLPDSQKIRQAEVVFASLTPEAHERKTYNSEEVRFFDSGSFFDKVICPVCKEEIEIEWWQDRMGDEFDSGCLLKPVIMPCCKAEKSLNELIYDAPQGFGRFALEAMNPGLFEIKKDEIQQLEAILDCDLRQILQHV